MGVALVRVRRTETGEGCEIDTSLFETSLSWMQSHIASYVVTRNVPGRRGTENPSLTPYKVFKAADDYVMIAAGTESMSMVTVVPAAGASRFTDPSAFFMINGRWPAFDMVSAPFCDSSST